MNRKLLIAHLFLMFVALFYGSNYTIAKLVMPKYIAPFGFILLRVVFAMVFFWGAYALFSKERVEKKDFKRLALCAVFGVALNQLTFFKGLVLTTPVNGALLMLTTPIVVLILAILMGKEKLTWYKAIGMTLGISGAAYLSIVSNSAQTTDAPNPLLGNIFVMINAVSYALYLINVKPMMEKYQPITILPWIFSFGFFYCLPFGATELLAVEWSTIPGLDLFLIFYVLFFVTCMTYLLNGTALKIVSPSVSSAYIYMQLLIATIISILSGFDNLTMYTVLAGTLIICGVFLVSKTKKVAKTEAEAEIAKAQLVD